MTRRPAFLREGAGILLRLDATPSRRAMFALDTRGHR